MILDLRILNELRGSFSEVRILKELVSSGLWTVSSRRKKIARDMMRHTRKSIAWEY